MTDKPKQKPVFSTLTVRGALIVVGTMTLGGITADMMRGDSFKSALSEGVIEGSGIFVLILIIRKVAIWCSKRQET